MRNSQFFQRRFWLQRYRVSENPFFHELIPALTSPFLDRTTTYWSGHDDTPSGSSTVELLIGYESEHKHYLNVSAATNLFVNLIGVCAGLILASWLLSIGVENAEVSCLGLVSVAASFVAMGLNKLLDIFAYQYP
ncbi:hypothetical protein KIW84_053431 [Lathyrus oleraceus]|uniref:Uncharacterized protein n=1 Tax=Pisum sativum TaxID=3888 RepID=A0A9D4WSZ0_PEA|nr:hypothetical protein KIW84_053431 [Pisum sativum]